MPTQYRPGCTKRLAQDVRGSRPRSKLRIRRSSGCQRARLICRSSTLTPNVKGKRTRRDVRKGDQLGAAGGPVREHRDDALRDLSGQVS